MVQFMKESRLMMMISQLNKTFLLTSEAIGIAVAMIIAIFALIVASIVLIKIDDKEHSKKDKNNKDQFAYKQTKIYNSNWNLLKRPPITKSVL